MSRYIRKYESAQTSHRHTGYHQIIIPLQGGLELDVEGRPGLVSGRTIGAVALGETHAFRAGGDNRFLVLDVADDTAEEAWAPIWSQAVDTPFLSMSEALVSLTDYALFCQKRGGEQVWLETWQRLFLQTLACDLENDLPALPGRIQKAIEYMQANLGRALRNADLADAAALSPARFHEVFRQSTGISPQQYLLNCRLAMAKRLMLKGHSLAQVADEVGFGDQSSFGRAFRKAYGVSPHQWRKSESETKK